MKSLRRFFSQLFNLATRRTQEERLREEIEEHIALQTEENLGAGLSPVEARRQAMIKFGGVEAMKEEHRAERGLVFLENLVRDVRFASWMLRKSAGFTIVAVVTLAAAIGANAVVFSALNAFVLRPLNVPEPESLYGLQFGEKHRGVQSYPNYVDFRDRNRSFDGLAIYQTSRVGLDTGDNPTRAWLYEVSGNYFDVLKLQPSLGRFFHSSDEHGAGSAPYIVVSYAYWHGHFQDDHSVVGGAVKVNKRPYTIIGVAPPEFRGTFLLLAPDFFVPMSAWRTRTPSIAAEAAGFGSRMATVALGVLGGLGALLSVTGIFGMAAYSVSRRLRELGIRMALGAQRKELLGAALGRAIKLLAFGSSAGLMLGILASRVLASLVHQATPRDPLVLGGVVLAIALLGLVATWIPAQRALSIDPAILCSARSEPASLTA
jgi:hypothetical protein